LRFEQVAGHEINVVEASTERFASGEIQEFFRQVNFEDTSGWTRRLPRPGLLRRRFCSKRPGCYPRVAVRDARSSGAEPVPKRVVDAVIRICRGVVRGYGCRLCLFALLYVRPRFVAYELVKTFRVICSIVDTTNEKMNEFN
jgi:hypothetical protein